jgi:hypothetical protein
MRYKDLNQNLSVEDILGSGKRECGFEFWLPGLGKRESRIDFCFPGRGNGKAELIFASRIGETGKQN